MIIDPIIMTYHTATKWICADVFSSSWYEDQKIKHQMVASEYYRPEEKGPDSVYATTYKDEHLSNMGEWNEEKPEDRERKTAQNNIRNNSQQIEKGGKASSTNAKAER